MNNYSLTFTPIHRNLLHSYWPQLKEFIGDALARAHDSMTLDDVLGLLIEGKSNLFGAFENHKPVGACTVEILQFPRTRIALIAQLGGHDIERLLTLLPQLDMWVRDHECDTMRLLGRRGWERMLAKEDFEFSYICLDRRL